MVRRRAIIMVGKRLQGWEGLRRYKEEWGAKPSRWQRLLHITFRGVEKKFETG